MKNLRVLCLLAFAVVCSTISAQSLDNANVFTVVYATSDAL